MKDLASYITQEPDELIMQCIAMTRAALNTDDAGFRETLLYAVFDKQIILAEVLGALNDNDLIN
ncbi:hypothetical protein [Gilliamella apis]|uniref:hypothetical protein n=1 Tax=Gilliamella apis TaxID=1970738 RepID=UPI000A336E18|nr:hypothetical protein [Gilliamella apis]OTQ34643.1 hypothetical protein B6C84_08630 [Gilliamella apis]OTQ36997.1 hypothetical protein B6C88_07150 [Gilliamella apis]OTQ40860.1 hypothetical protein B6D26_04665 [Gilliamella apis]OTQ42615.1 hypothetical protein B6C94_06500 [Gilliamella apis]OTQ46405.1 hypothetical protein B6C86_04505 [Gilliamella apis]